MRDFVKTGKKIIVISAINLRMGGGLTILRDCLQYLSQSNLHKDYQIISLVHKRELADFPNIEYMEFPKSAQSWLKRICYEYFSFRKLSKQLKPYLWLSLHDITPNVKAETRAVYMHNPSIVNKIKKSDWKYDKTYIAFSLFYKFLYRINIHKNNYCIVQQQWFREVCAALYNISPKQIIVARPNVLSSQSSFSNRVTIGGKCKTFFYPSLPRPFKNFETVCEAMLILEKNGVNDINLILTIDGSENEYAKDIVTKYGHCSLISFTGLLNKSEMEKAYNESDALIFPSRLETWGLPISEYIPTHKPMILADEPYAHETSQGASSVVYYPTNDSIRLSTLIQKLRQGDYTDFKPQPFKELSSPKAQDYRQLFDILLKK